MAAITVVRRKPSSVIEQADRDLHPVLQRVLSARGIASVSELDYRLDRLAPPQGLGQLEAAATRIADALVRGEETLVVGDFDADGATGAALLVLALREMGHPAVDFTVPNRFDFGYGLSTGLLQSILADAAPSLIITVDNGISSLHGIAAAREADIDVVVTDHHLPGAELPEAHAIVNPNLPDATFPSRHLAGVGVAFYVLAAVRSELLARGHFQGRRPPQLGDWLDLVALGTVADVVPLDHNNRILVAQGLRRIRRGNCRPGIRALLEAARRDLGRTTAADLAFFLAPRLNAAGRLEDMAVGIRCLLTDDPDEARRLANRLDLLNRERRQIQEDMETAALDDLPADGRHRLLCLFREDWHQGVVGLVASRMKERAHRPVFAFAPEQPGSSVLKGSGRSIPGFHIRDALAAIATDHPGLIDRFGGHAMAAGLTLSRDALDPFRQAAQAFADRHLSEADLANHVYSDGELAPEDMTVELAMALRDWGPWGQAFPEPTFDGWFDILDRRPIGTGHSRLRVSPRGVRRPIEAVLFNQPLDTLGDRTPLHFVYQLGVNEYLGQITPQLVVRHVL